MLTADGRTVAWLVVEKFQVDGADMWGASSLVIQQDGRQRTITCEPFIRDFWFWKRGKYVAIDCAGNHFAGSEILYEIDSLKKVDSINAGEVPIDKRPAWSNSSKAYRED